MYLKHLEIRNIRSVTAFIMDFEKYPGWHVLIGDNGSGKSSVIRAIALGLIGPREVQGIKPNWNEWLKWKKNKGGIVLDFANEERDPVNNTVELSLRRTKGHVILEGGNESIKGWSDDRPLKGQFSAGYGPFRRYSRRGWNRVNRDRLAQPKEPPCPDPRAEAVYS